MQGELLDRTQTFANLTADGIVDAYKTGNKQLVNNYITKVTATDSSITGVSLLSPAAEVLYSKGGVIANTSSNAQAYYDGEGDLRNLVVASDDGEVAAVNYQVSDRLVTEGIRKQVQSILTFSLIGTIVAALATLLLVDKSVIRPIRKLTGQASQISNGDYTKPADNTNRADEIGILTRSMQTMQSSLKFSTERLSQLDNAKSEFMMIASHSLRTPITVIKSSL